MEGVEEEEEEEGGGGLPVLNGRLTRLMRRVVGRNRCCRGCGRNRLSPRWVLPVLEERGRVG